MSGAFAGTIRRAEPLHDSAGRYDRFVPLRSYDTGIVPRLNAFYGSPALQTTIEGLAFRCEPTPIANEMCSAATVEFRWTIGDQPLALALPRVALGQLLDRMQPGSAEAFDDAAIALVVELALAPALDAIEPAIGAEVRLDGLRPALSRGASGPSPDTERLLFHCDLDGRSFAASLEMEHFDPRFRRTLLETATRLLKRGSGPPRRDCTALPLLVSFQAGSVRLSVAALKSLQAGDVVLPDDFPLARGELAVLCHGKYRAPARVDARTATLQAPLQRIVPTPEETSMADGPAPSQQIADLDDIDLQLTFELGRQTVELEQLRTIAPGYVFPLGRSPDEPVDIVANGRRIGRGEIVRVGDSLGVRLIRLFDHD